MREYKEQRPERDLANMTLYRTANFFVHAFTPVVRTGSLQKTSGNATILERVRWTSAEKQRLMAAQTRLLPQVETVEATQWHEISIPAGLEVLAVAAVLVVTLLIQFANIFTFPSYGAEEGNVMANAWALLHGQIVPYVYTYDQPPIGWLQLAGWLQITGGIGSFGNAINSGRVFMLVLSLASSLLLYLTASRISGSRSAALLATVIYAFSPLSLVFRREVLLENIAVFWLLLALCLISMGKSRLQTFVFAGVALGIAILSDGVFLFFLPAMLYAVWLYATPFQRKFSLLTFLYIVLTVVSAYALLALLKGELLPAGLLPGDAGTHKSLLGALIQQVQTPIGNGQFAQSWNTWQQTDRILLLAGGVAIVLNILGSTVNRFQLLAALLGVTYGLILLLSHVVEPFSIVPLLPFLALNIVLAINTPLRWLTRKSGFDLVRALLFFLLLGALIPASIQQARPVLAQNVTNSQQQALLWMRDNAPHTAAVVTPSYLFTDLREQGGMGVGNGTPFTRVFIYSYVVPDSQLYNEQLKGDWQQVDFLVVDETMLKDLRDNAQFALLNQALHHAILRVSFGSGGDGTQIQIYQVNHT